MKNILFLVVDGLGDEYIPKLAGTPLEYASSKLENMNKMTSEGICGLHWPVKPGIPPSSGKAHLSLFGYDVEKLKVGRGVFEALGTNMKLEKNEIAFRTNFATVRKKKNELIVVDRRAGRIKKKDAEALANTVKKKIKNWEVQTRFKHTVEHRGVLIIKGENLSDKITDTDPHQIGKPVIAPQPIWGSKEEERQKAEKTCDFLEKATKCLYNTLKKDSVNEKRRRKGKKPANILLIRGGGSIAETPSFKEKWGMKATYTAEAPLYKGVARFLGMEHLSVEESLDFSANNEKKRILKAIDVLNDDYDFVFLHIKLADNLSHSKKPKKVVEYLKNLDRSFEPILKEDNLLVILTGDHSSSSRRGRHTGMPVPLLFWGDTPRDACTKFNENELADKGGLGTVHGKDIMPITLDLADRAEELGIKTDPKLHRYKTSKGKTLKLH